MKIGILNYNACNLASIYNSIFRLGHDPQIIEKRAELKSIDKLIIPGVGAAKNCLDYLKKNDLFSEVEIFFKKEKPILGICLGLQIFSKNLFEHGKSSGFNLIDADVVSFPNKKINIGWRRILISDKDWIEFNNKSFYFCHSYLLKFNSSTDKKYCKARINSQEEIPSLIIKKNFVGTQFHPEKSQTVGNKFIEKFLNWEPNN
jgi:imidazole glycerol-phosphate synthase subunit HisH